MSLVVQFFLEYSVYRSIHTCVYSFIFIQLFDDRPGVDKGET